MKALCRLLIIVSAIGLMVSPSSAQDKNDFDLSYEVYVDYPALSRTPQDISKATTLEDLNRYYESAWVSEPMGLEIQTLHNGKSKITRSATDKLNADQIKNIQSADPGSEIAVRFKYIPDNTLSHNDPKEFAFDFEVNPKENATYIGGTDQLQQYLKQAAIDKLDKGVFTRYQLAAVKFTIDQDGHVCNAHIFESTKNTDVDNLLLQAIREMPKWSPAKYYNGLATEQQMVLTIGDKESCTINLLNIRREQ